MTKPLDPTVSRNQWPFYKALMYSSSFFVGQYRFEIYQASHNRIGYLSANMRFTEAAQLLLDYDERDWLANQIYRIARAYNSYSHGKAQTDRFLTRLIREHNVITMTLDTVMRYRLWYLLTRGEIDYIVIERLINRMLGVYRFVHRNDQYLNETIDELLETMRWLENLHLIDERYGLAISSPRKG